MNEKLFAEILERNSKGETVKDICLDLGISRNNVYCWCKKRDLKLRSSCTAGPKRKLSPDDHQEVVQRYLSGESCTQIAKEYGVSHKTILAALKRNGLTARTKEENWEFNGNPYINSEIASCRSSKNAKRYGYGLSYDEFVSLVTSPCYYCGWAATKHVRGNRGKDDGLVLNGIDRVNSDDGYFPWNVAPCCKYCNTAKSNMTLEEFAYWIQGLTEVDTVSRIRKLIEVRKSLYEEPVDQDN